MPDDRASATPGVSADQVTFYVEGSNYSLQIPREIKDMVRMSTAQEASNYDKLFVVDSDAPLQTIQPNAFKQVNFISGSDEYELFTIYTYNTSQYEQQVKNNGFYTLKVLNQTADTTDVLAIPTVSPIKSGEAFADEYTLALQAVNMFQPTGTENVAMTTSTPSMQTAAPTTMPTDNAAYLTYDRVKTINGDKFVPVREVLEKLGYTVSWDAKTKGISVTKGNIYKSISTRRIIGTNPQSTNAIAGSCAVIENDIAYMPLPYFKDVLGLNIEDDVNESISFK